MKVLMTGATGFLGRHLTRALGGRGHTVVAARRAGADARRLAAVDPPVVSYEVGPGWLDRLFAEQGGVDAVVHLAVCYGRGGEGDVDVFRTNTAFGLELLDGVAARGVPTFLNADTCINAGPLTFRYYRNYALSKRQFVEWGEHYAFLDKVRFVNVKLQHPYGPGDHPSKFNSYVVRECLANTPRLDLSPGEQRKDFVFVDDVVDAFLLLLGRAPALGANFLSYECGTGSALSVREFVETVHALTGSTTQLCFGALPYRPDELMHSQADPRPLMQLGWAPRWGLEDGIRRILRDDYGLCDPPDVGRGRVATPV